MNKSIAFAAAFALVCGCATVAIAVASDTIVTCKDGTRTNAGSSVCFKHGGVQNTENASTPIDTTKGFAPNATATKTKTHTTTASNTTHKKTASKATSSPTAKCKDGAMYFSTERRGACASHGGVDKWYIW
ncbi:MAG TPA: DUF3761 domain-containing protein [Steroidobacteraceae bacterium]|nr:DUF3761 domain-containing protein [Steroidobacteraceae bacterium]